MILLTAPREDLLAALQAVTGIVERRPALPALGQVLIRRQPGSLTLTTTDLACQVDLTLDWGGGAEIATTVGAHRLLDIVRALPPGHQLTLALAPADGRATLTSGGSRFTLQTLPPEDFPARPQGSGSDSVGCRLPRALLADALDRVAFAMAARDIRYYLNGVLLRLDGDTLTAVATDGNRLALAEAPVAAGPAQALEFIVPRKTVHAWQRLLRAASDAEVTLAVAPKQVRLACRHLVFTSQLIEGRFPDYRRAIPAAQGPTVGIARLALRDALERAALMTSDSFRGVRLSFADGQLRISAHNAAQEEAVEEIALEAGGPTLQIGLNAGYLLDLLAHGDGERVQMTLRDAHSSVLFTLPERPGLRYVVGPMRL